MWENGSPICLFFKKAKLKAWKCLGDTTRNPKSQFLYTMKSTIATAREGCIPSSYNVWRVQNAATVMILRCYFYIYSNEPSHFLCSGWRLSVCRGLWDKVPHVLGWCGTGLGDLKGVHVLLGCSVTVQYHSLVFQCQSITKGKWLIIKCMLITRAFYWKHQHASVKYPVSTWQYLSNLIYIGAFYNAHCCIIYAENKHSRHA